MTLLGANSILSIESLISELTFDSSEIKVLICSLFVKRTEIKVSGRSLGLTAVDSISPLDKIG